MYDSVIFCACTLNSSFSAKNGACSPMSAAHQVEDSHCGLRSTFPDKSDNIKYSLLVHFSSICQTIPPSSVMATSEPQMAPNQKTPTASGPKRNSTSTDPDPGRGKGRSMGGRPGLDLYAITVRTSGQISCHSDGFREDSAMGKLKGYGTAAAPSLLGGETHWHKASATVMDCARAV